MREAMAVVVDCVLPARMRPRSPVILTLPRSTPVASISPTLVRPSPPGLRLDADGEIGVFEAGIGEGEKLELIVQLGVGGEGEILGFEGSLGDGDGDDVAIEIGEGGALAAGQNVEGGEELSLFELFDEAGVGAAARAGGFAAAETEGGIDEVAEAENHRGAPM